MKTVVVKIDPPEVDIEDTEDFLATDDLFIEYFNLFLALPTFLEPLCFNKDTGGFEVVSDAKKELAKKIKDAICSQQRKPASTFPEPLCFNKDTGGFEVVSDAKKELAKKIKDAIRSQQRKPRIYRVAKRHSFIDIPLYPIETDGQQENAEILTSFSVTTLNKEQGIHWIKAERLPAFLESELYLEYRLSKLMSQARVTGEQGEYVLMRIDFKPRVKKVVIKVEEKEEEEEPPVQVKKKAEEEQVQVDPKESLMKEMYVCMGNAGTTETDSWYVSARIASDQETTTTTTSAASRPQSETIRPKPSVIRPTSARPASAYSDPYNRSDSGMGASLRGSVKNGSYGTVYQSRYNVSETDDEIMMSKLFSSERKLKLNESMCMVDTDHSQSPRPFSSTVYSTPKSEPLTELDDTDLDINGRYEGKDDEKDSGKGDEGDEATEFNESVAGDSEAGKAIVCKNIDEVGTVITGVVLKAAIQTLTDMDEAEIQKIPVIAEMLPDSSFSNLSLDSLDKLTVLDMEKAQGDAAESEPENKQTINEQMKKTIDEESDVDSLLDSEEDYEECDVFFRKHKYRTYSLTNLKGVGMFKKFLQGTLGERNWNLWVDIDRMRLMKNQEEIQLYLCGMREQYHSPGAPFELSTEQKVQLDLVEPSQWNVDKLLSVQNQIVEPLILYWAPRFLLKQLMRSDPQKNLLYQHLRSLKPYQAVNPSPPTATLLPLRPKSCHPRVTRDNIMVQQGIQIEPLLDEPSTNDTSPPVGMKRSYLEPTLKFISNWQREQSVHTQLLSPTLQVERTSTPRLRGNTQKRSGTAPNSPRPGSAMRYSRPPSAARSTRPSTARSSSSRMSVESATGRMRVKSATQRARSPQLTIKLPGEERTRSRPSSAASSIASVRSIGGDSDTSEFLGGRRMEHMLQALHKERESGGFFRRYVERSNRKVWINNLNLWRDVQAYHMLFYGESLDPYVVEKKAKSIYSLYIVVGARQHIGCDVEVTATIKHQLMPPFEELFDAAEEHSIGQLYLAWHEMWETDQKTYKKVELIEVKRHLETKSKYVHRLQKSGLIKERVSSPDVMEGYEDPVYDEALLANIPEEFKDYTLDKLVHNRIELEHFRNFLAENYASMDIMCWMDIEAFRRIPHQEEKKRDVKAREVKTKYLNKKYFFGPNSPAGKEGQEKVMEAGGGPGKLLEDRPPTPMILEAQKYVQERLEKKWLPLFLVTAEFAIRQKPRQSMDDVVEDVLVQKKKKSLNMLKLLDSKWVSSSKEIITFRKALLNPVTSVQFRRFASIKGDTLENDVLFWLEVQKYKDMYHAHNDQSLLDLKVNTIINCFLDSQIPPTLQIDIPPDMAEKVVERKYERSPYLFREAQLVVFRILFPHWNEFCEFRLNLADEKIMPTIERRRKHARIKEKRKAQEAEEKQAREAERRAAMGLPPLGEDEDVFQDPFKAMGAGGGAESMDGDAQDEPGADRISWSYSNYMAALEKEELLNNTDETSFTSLLTDTASVKSEATDKASGGSQPSDPERKGSKVDGESQTTDKRKLSIRTNGEMPGLGKRRSKDMGSTLGSKSSLMDMSERGGDKRRNSHTPKVQLPKPANS